MAMVKVYSITDHGAMTFVGNTLGLSQTQNTNNAGITGSIGAYVNANTAAAANATWPGGTTLTYTQNYSQAQLTVLPAGSKILHAELVWGGELLISESKSAK